MNLEIRQQVFQILFGRVSPAFQSPCDTLSAVCVRALSSDLICGIVHGFT